jgi:hypothetical protein
MHVLSVDIAARKGRMNCGLALIDPSKLVELGEPADDLVWTRTIDATELATISRTLAGVRAELGAPFLLALERQFSARVSPDPTAVEKLMRTRIQFETVAEIRGIACELVYPATWRTILNVLGDGVPMKISKPRKPPKPKGKRGAPPPAPEPEKPGRNVRDFQAGARLLAERLYPGIELTKDQCDALLLARHVGWHRRAA